MTQGALAASMPRAALFGAALLATACPWLLLLVFPACRAGRTECWAHRAPGVRYVCPRDFATGTTVQVAGYGLTACARCAAHGVAAGDTAHCDVCAVPWVGVPQCANFFSRLYAPECTLGVVRNVRGRWLQCKSL